MHYSHRFKLLKPRKALVAAAFLVTALTTTSSAATLTTLGISLDAPIRLGGITLLDQSPLDLDPTVGVLGFSSTVRGFQITGSLLSVIPDPLDPSVRLQNVSIQCTNTLIGCGALPLVFFGTFAQSEAVPNATAFDLISGTFSNPNGLSAGTGLQFQGFVNGTPVASPFVFTAPAGATSASFSDSDEIPFVLAPGLILLDGVVNVTLAGLGDRLDLQFAEVGVEPSDEPGQIPEPATVWFAGLGTIALLAHKRVSQRWSRK